MASHLPQQRTPSETSRPHPEVIRLAVMLYVKYPLSLRNVEDLLAERGIDIAHETIRYWGNRFGPMFAVDIRQQRASSMRGYRQWRWHLEMYESAVTAMGLDAPTNGQSDNGH